MRSYPIFLMLVLTLAVAAAESPAASSDSPAPIPTPAGIQVSRAQEAVAAHPGDHRRYNSLALACTRRARETADPVWYRRAAEALARSFQLEPGNLEARKLEVWILLGRHEFARALPLAEALQRLVPDDLMVNGLLVDARVEMGRYAEAEEAAQWLLDLRPGNVVGLTRGAYLRELFGDHAGALEFMHDAFTRTPPHQVEDRAWLLTQMAHLELNMGRADAAGQAAQAALELFPDYHYALQQMGKARAAQGRHAEAVEFLTRHVEAAPHPENYFYLAEAQSRAGQAEAAQATFARFEKEARAEMEGNDNANRELVYYYADHAGRPREALRLARAEFGRRQDVFTRGALAWALHRAGESDAAQKEVAVIRELGTAEPELLQRMEVILPVLVPSMAPGAGQAAARIS